MTTATPTWQELFVEQRHALLANISRKHQPDDVRSLADDEILLVGGTKDAARPSEHPRKSNSTACRCVVLTPEGPQQTFQEFQSVLRRTRAEHPEAEVSGYGPLSAEPSQRFQGLDRGVFLIGRAGSNFEPAGGLDSFRHVEAPLTAVLVYSPDLTPSALTDAVEHLGRIPALTSVVPLPAGAGDRIPLIGLTTSGTTDLMTLSVLRFLLPSAIRIRASWAALGWKVAQVALAYGADEIAGWTGAEGLAYTGRVRAASRVERLELSEGLAEARRINAGWNLSRARGYQA